MKDPYHKARLKAFGYALSGIRSFAREPHARLQLIISGVVLAASFYFGLSSLEWICVLFCCGGVLTAEAFNSAVEHLTDLANPEWNAHAGKVKDIAAGAVLITSVFAAVIGLIIFIPKIIYLFSHGQI